MYKRQTQKEDSTAEKEDGASGGNSSGDEKEGAAESQDKADARTDDQKLLETAEAFVKDLIAGSEENIKGNYEYTDQMKAAVDSGQILSAFQSTLDAVGELKEVQPAWESEPQAGYNTIQVPCDFTVQPLNMVISVLDGRIGGVHTGCLLYTSK